MNISIKTLLALAVFLLPACKRNPSTPYVQKVYEEAVRLQQAGNLNDAIFHYQLAATSCHTIEDSLSYWWKAMYGQGEIWKRKNFLEDARRDLEAVLRFAKKHRLDTAAYMAYRPLTLIYLKNEMYGKAYTHALRAQDIASGKNFPDTLTQGQSEEAVIAFSAYAWHTRQEIPDTIYRRLAGTAASPDMEHRILALGLLALYKERGTATNPYLTTYIESCNRYWKTHFRHFTDEAEREKKQLIAERDAFAERERNVLFISLTLFSLLVCGAVFVASTYRNKHAIDRIRLILKQKEETIRYLEAQKGNDESLRLQIEEKEKEWHQQELQIRSLHLYDMEVGRKIPSADNPHAPQPKDYTNLMSDAGQQVKFLKEMDYCFNNFATGLQQLIPDLTIEETAYCCLFHLNIRTSDIAEMFSRSKSTISSRRKRLEAKINAKN